MAGKVCVKTALSQTPSAIIFTPVLFGILSLGYWFVDQLCRSSYEDLSPGKTS